MVCTAMVISFTHTKKYIVESNGQPSTARDCMSLNTIHEYATKATFLLVSVCSPMWCTGLVLECL